MIRATGVSKRYGQLTVLNGIDLTIPEGEVTAIIGPNASGKSTFNKIVLGLVRPDAGVVTVGGVSIAESSLYRHEVGYMPQAPRFPENLRPADVFAMLTDLRHSAAVGDRKRDDELLDLFELAPALRTPMRVLSGGMRQRINAALAFLFSPRLLILDEPTAALDPISSATLKDKIRRERENGKTFVVTSHVLSELEGLADRIVFLLDGGVRFAGRPAELLSQTGAPTLERAVAHVMRDRLPGARMLVEHPQ